MAQPIRVPASGFERKRLEIVPAGVLGPRVMLDGQRQAAERREFHLTDDQGAKRILKLRNSFLLDPVPIVELDGQDVHIARPLTVAEKAWMLLPFGLIAVGGALGGLFGALAGASNARILRSTSSPARHFACLGVTVGAALAYVVAASIFTSIFPRK